MRRLHALAFAALLLAACGSGTTTVETVPVAHETPQTAVSRLPVRWADENRTAFYAAHLWRSVTVWRYASALRYASAVDAAYDAARQRAAVETAPPVSTPRKSSPSRASGSVDASGRCGGSLPPCYVMMRESRGDIRAENPTSSASGKWQFIDSTWAGFGGYARASHAPESVQDEKARQLWAGGAGCSHWSAC
jgi:hypothetical protein